MRRFGWLGADLCEACGPVFGVAFGLVVAQVVGWLKHSSALISSLEWVTVLAWLFLETNS